MGRKQFLKEIGRFAKKLERATLIEEQDALHKRLDLLLDGIPRSWITEAAFIQWGVKGNYLKHMNVTGHTAAACKVQDELDGRLKIAGMRGFYQPDIRFLDMTAGPCALGLPMAQRIAAQEGFAGFTGRFHVNDLTLHVLREAASSVRQALGLPSQTPHFIATGLNVEGQTPFEPKAYGIVRIDQTIHLIRERGRVLNTAIEATEPGGLVVFIDRFPDQLTQSDFAPRIVKYLFGKLSAHERVFSTHADFEEWVQQTSDRLQLLEDLIVRVPIVPVGMDLQSSPIAPASMYGITFQKKT